MKIILLIGFLVTATLAEESPYLQYFAINNNKFASEIYKELQTSNLGNFLVCPLSLETVLTLLHTGAAGKTAQELSNGLHLPECSEEILNTYKVLSRRLQSTAYYNLTSANKIYVDKKFHIKEAFKTNAIDVFDAEIQNIDFEDKAQATNQINNWIEKKTHNTIKSALGEDALDDVAAVLINAIYFRVKWARPFKKTDTTKRSFWVNTKTQTDTEMMEQTNGFVYYENKKLDAKFLKLPYAGVRNFINLVIVLPNDKDGLPALESRMEEVYEARDAYPESVHVVLPKFVIETSIDLKPVLQKLGIVDVFENSANLRGVIEDADVKVSKVFQKAFIDVDEEGTTASAATVLVPNPTSADYEPPPPQQFIADHPFIFYLTVKDIVLFTGRYSLPAGN